MEAAAVEAADDRGEVGARDLGSDGGRRTPAT